MKRLLMLGTLALCVIFADQAFAGGDKIDPEDYICAQLSASQTDGETLVFEALQIDGYASGQSGQKIADPNSLRTILAEAVAACSAKPTDKILDHWGAALKRHPGRSESVWNAEGAVCADYAADPDDGSGFVIWLDGYRRGKSKDSRSVLGSQETLDKFLDACKAAPQRLIIDVLSESAR